MEAPIKPIVYSPELKLAAVRSFLEGGMTRREVIEHYNIASVSTFKKWVIAYRRKGPAGLASRSQGRPQARRTAPMIDPIEASSIRAEVERLKRKLG